MARIRSIKPEFWTSEQVVDCSPTARLMFIGMWNFCDDYGNCPASFKQIKMQVFPGDDISTDEIENLIKELKQNKLLIEYQSDDEKKYWHVTGWHHQKIEKPAAKYPKFDDQSTTNLRLIDDCPPADVDVDRRGKEDNKVTSVKIKKDSISKEIVLSKIQKEFYDHLKDFVDDFSKETLREFYNYWSEPNKSKTKIKWQLQKTWDTKRRLQTWERNESKFNKNAKTFNHHDKLASNRQAAAELAAEVAEKSRNFVEKNQRARAVVTDAQS